MTLLGAKAWHFLNSKWTAGAIALAVFCIAMATIAMLSAIRSPRLDAGFPSAASDADLRSLRKAYSGPPATWPQPQLLADARFTEMGSLTLHAPSAGKARLLARLGSELFEDPRLSASGHVACQSCHNRRLGWGDALPTPFGHGRAKGKRNAQSLFSVGYKSSFFWDGRSNSLEDQALGPLTDHSEMANHDISALLTRINAVDRYRSSFAEVTGKDTIDLDALTSALAAFQRTLDRRTRFDRFADGETRVMTDVEIWGLHLFRSKAKCANCHSGPTLSDGRFHNLGLSFFNRTLEDLGRYGVTGAPSDTGRFLTPSLRHISKTGPYMHNGIFPSLSGLIRFYEAGGGRIRADLHVNSERKALLDAAVKKSPQLEGFELTPSERAALLAFLNTL
ncbi:cytochrome c peroxidase [Hyphomicrobium sp. LHD-15]|uniref:cytochrome-c peroxidase n=1 Tax=Hyphomicrobium sp. LHD-15 TaxID=3072142 RepID=UPI00280DD43F|nr:cytochrome c peroxidase [Hyphomicrobium sp. LHD-15]MDQ8699212.1 cytochrome c peroxidase [Hyphomicrobium sp. LHD-15]